MNTYHPITGLTHKTWKRPIHYDAANSGISVPHQRIKLTAGHLGVSPRVRDFLNQNECETPVLVVDLDIVALQFRKLRAAFPDASVYFAVKANPAPEIIRLLVRLGAFFDVASRAELDLCLDEGARPDHISYGNTIKKASDIAHAHSRGIRLFAFDSHDELQKIAENAPGSSVFCRILIDNTSAQWPLNRKFGCSKDMAVALLIDAQQLGLNPVGVSFHVGSQQMDPSRWDTGIKSAASIFEQVAQAGIDLKILNLGGGFPAAYRQTTPGLEDYTTAIMESLRRRFGGAAPDVILEPGRSLVGDAGVIRSEVVLVSRKSHDDDARWVYVDVGRFRGLAETENEAISYPIVAHRNGGPSGPVILAGPSCDSVDILYEKTPYELPLDLRSGDYIDILSTGAYTASYSSVGFNGFDPLPTYCVGGHE